MSTIFTKKEMKTILDETRIGIDNSLDNQAVLEKVQPFGHTPESFAEIENLRQEAERLYLVKDPKAGQKISLSIQLKTEINQIHDLFMLYEKMIRRDLKEDPALFSEFGFYSPLDRTISGKIKDSKGFYRNCLDNQRIGTYVIKYGLTTETLQANIDRIAEVEKDKNVRAIMVKEAEKTTEDRNKVFRKLNAWWQNYKLVLLHVFRDDPQQLEAFGIKGYSEGYKPKPKEKPAEPAEEEVPNAEQPETVQEEPST